MRVLQVIADGSLGGGTTHVLQLLRGLPTLSQQGLATQRGSYLSRTARELGTPCFEFSPFGGLALLRAPGELRRIVDEFEPDLVHAHGSRAGFLVALAGAQVPFVYTVHGLHILHRPSLSRWLGVQAERLTNRGATLTIFVSDADRTEALQRHLLPAAHPMRVVPNALAVPSPLLIPKPEPRHVGYVGRLEPPKDPRLFLQVMELLPGYHATMVGGGSLEARVRAAVAKRPDRDIRLLGPLSPQATLEVMGTFEVLVVPSLWEAFGLVALEAMAIGVPVVATRVGGLPEVVEDGVSGVLVASRSPRDLAEAVRRVSEDPSLRQRLIEGGKARVREHFSGEQMIRRVGEVYREALQGSGIQR